MKYYSYEEFKKDTNLLINKTTKFNPEAIVAIARGGLSLAQCIAEGLDIREVQSIRTELYDGMDKRNKISVYDTTEFKSVTRILVVDDIADSGETLAVVMKHLQEKYPNIEFQSVTLFYKKSSVYEPTHWINEADDWIDFFWERDFKS